MEPKYITWGKAPPAAGRKIGSNQRLILMLQARPGEWASFDGFATSGRAASCAQALRALGAEARSFSDVDAGIFTVYARWPEDAS